MRRATLSPPRSAGPDFLRPSYRPACRKMNERFHDHAANERPFLARIHDHSGDRGAVVMIERSDHMISRNGPADRTARAVGLVLLLIGIQLIAGAIVRFVLTKRAIEAQAGLRAGRRRCVVPTVKCAVGE